MADGRESQATPVFRRRSDQAIKGEKVETSESGSGEGVPGGE